MICKGKEVFAAHLLCVMAFTAIWETMFNLACTAQTTQLKWIHAPKTQKLWNKAGVSVVSSSCAFYTAPTGLSLERMALLGAAVQGLASCQPCLCKVVPGTKHLPLSCCAGNSRLWSCAWGLQQTEAGCLSMCDVQPLKAVWILPGALLPLSDLARTR